LGANDGTVDGDVVGRLLEARRYAHGRGPINRSERRDSTGPAVAELLIDPADARPNQIHGDAGVDRVGAHPAPVAELHIDEVRTLVAGATPGELELPDDEARSGLRERMHDHRPANDIRRIREDQLAVADPCGGTGCLGLEPAVADGCAVRAIESVGEQRFLSTADVAPE
jgi:hypothetical protein